MADRWFFGHGAYRSGPFSGSELRQFALNGQLQPTDTVWKEGVEAGVVASHVKNLFPPAPIMATRPAPAAPMTPAAPSAPAPTPGPVTAPASGAEEPSPAAVETATGKRQSTRDSESVMSPSAEGPSPSAPAAAPVAGAATEIQPTRQQPKKEKAVVQSVSGGILVSQDGKYMQYRKKCRKCGFEDAARTSLPIRNGVVRQMFYCPKCRKPSDVEIRGRA